MATWLRPPSWCGNGLPSWSPSPSPFSTESTAGRLVVVNPMPGAGWGVITPSPGRCWLSSRKLLLSTGWVAPRPVIWTSTGRPVRGSAQMSIAPIVVPPVGGHHPQAGRAAPATRREGSLE